MVILKRKLTSQPRRMHDLLRGQHLNNGGGDVCAIEASSRSGFASIVSGVEQQYYSCYSLMTDNGPNGQDGCRAFLSLCRGIEWILRFAHRAAAGPSQSSGRTQISPALAVQRCDADNLPGPWKLVQWLPQTGISMPG